VARLARRTGLAPVARRAPHAVLLGPLGLLVGIHLGGVPGAGTGVGIGAAAGALLTRRAASTAQHHLRRQVDRDLPLALDLLSAALSAGLTPVAATLTAGRVLHGSLGTALLAVAARARAGLDPWSALEEPGNPTLQRLAAAARRSAESGAPLQPWIAAVVLDLRSQDVPRAEEAARAAGAWAVLPLGLCFLPAYLALGVVPALIGLTSRLAVLR
jgi:Flp pilus assembly protein TadB